jgi:hypothetical protein
MACSVTAIQKGISLPGRQRLLGHDRLTTTEIYSTSRRKRWSANSTRSGEMVQITSRRRDEEARKVFASQSVVYKARHNYLGLCHSR